MVDVVHYAAISPVKRVGADYDECQCGCNKEKPGEEPAPFGLIFFRHKPLHFSAHLSR